MSILSLFQWEIIFYSFWRITLDGITTYPKVQLSTGAQKALEC